MQQQINSFTYQLGQNLQKSVLQCHPSQPLFYMGARQKQKNQSSSAQKSFIYRLHFDQQNPRKSDLKRQQIPGYINGIHSYSKDSQDLLIITSDKNHKYQLSKTVYPLLQDQKIKLQPIIQSQSKISVVSHKQSKKHFLVGDRTIHLLNQDSFTKGQELVNVGEGRVITSSIVDPIHELLTYVLDQRQIIVSDKSLKKQKYAIKLSSSDLSPISSIDYNPNKQYSLLSCHLQCLKFWDIRKPSLPIKVYTDHHSLLLNSKYNPSHDELISCCYDDGTVGLLRMNSVSSVPGDGHDSMVKLYDQHYDSVYGLGWAGSSPWLFASIGYQAANVVLNYVPSVEKYRILL